MRSKVRAFVWLFLVLQAVCSPVAAKDAATENAQEIATQSSDKTDELAAANRRVQELEQRDVVREAKTELADGAYSRLEILVGIYGLLITVVVLFLALRTKDAAIAEARNVARETIDATRKELAELQKTVVAAQVQSQEKIEEIGRLADRIKEMERETQASLGRTRVHEESAARHANELFEQGRATGSKPEERSKSPKVAEALEAAEVESRKTAQDEWSTEQYQSAINKALWLDEDLSRAESLANAMMVRFADDPAASAFAHEALADVASNRKDWATALAGFEEAYRLLEKIGDAKTPSALRIRHQQGYVLNQLERSSEAECLLRELVPLRHRVDGTEAFGTLASRHELARALLDQGRASEAEAELRAILPLSQKVEGPEASTTLASRHELARAMLNQGRASEAEAEFRAILPLKEKVDGSEASGTLTTRHELARAMLEQGRASEAEAELRSILPLTEKVDGSEASGTLTTRHVLARAMLDQGRAAEAEAELRKILPLTEKVDGPEASGTLVTRHVMACAILNQDRAAEAEAELRLILPLTEKVDGPDASHTHITRYVLALAVTENGDPAGAQDLLEAVSDLSGRPDWLPRHAARLAYVRGKVADALDQRKDATAHLAEARRIYSEHFPEDYVYRRQLEDYITQRGGL